jgi:hypothetical protein
MKVFKSITIAIACFAAVPILDRDDAIAQSNVVTQSTTYQRSPEAIERQRQRQRLRRREARRRQLEWRRKYGDLAPSRQRSEQ